MVNIRENPNDSELRVAEYVLGTLSGDERRAFEAELANQPDLRTAVAAWEKRLAPLTHFVEPAPPSPNMWARIDAALPAVNGRPKLEVIQGTGGADKLRRAVTQWRRATVGMGALAAVLAVALVGVQVYRPVRVSGEKYVAVVNRGGDQPALIVRVDLANGVVQVRPVQTEAPADKSLELWYIGAGAKPKSMGVIGQAALKLTLPVKADAQGLDKALFAVTLEPKGGSPSGDPTGPIVYKGQMIKE